MTFPVISAALVALIAAIPAAAGGDDDGPRDGRLRKKLRARFQALDTDGDGRLSATECAGAPRLAGRFDTIDVDRDGFLTKGELRAALKTAVKRKMRAKWKALDADGDKRISAEEAEAAPRLAQHFDRIDADGDGFITRDEARAARKRLREQRHGGGMEAR